MVKIVLHNVSEHDDVDLLVVEELASSGEFASWWLECVGVRRAGVSAIEHSVSTANGESDIEVSVNGERRTRIMIENKVDAMFQPRQPERYRERAERYVREGVCDHAMVVLLAPKVYIESCMERNLFDAALPLEEVRGALVRIGRDESRLAYKLALLDRAIERGANGWTRVMDAHATEFYQRYFDLVNRIAPQLEMRLPSNGVPAGSTWIYFKPGMLPRGMDLVHKIPKGHVDLQFAGMGQRISELMSRFGRQLEPGMTIARAQKSATVRITVPPGDVTQPFATVAETMGTAVESAARLLAW